MSPVLQYFCSISFAFKVLFLVKEGSSPLIVIYHFPLFLDIKFNQVEFFVVFMQKVHRVCVPKSDIMAPSIFIISDHNPCESMQFILHVAHFRSSLTNLLDGIFSPEMN